MPATQISLYTVEFLLLLRTLSNAEGASSAPPVGVFATSTRTFEGRWICTFAVPCTRPYQTPRRLEPDIAEFAKRFKGTVEGVGVQLQRAVTPVLASEPSTGGPARAKSDVAPQRRLETRRAANAPAGDRA